MADGLVKVGEVDVSGEWLSNEGSIHVGGSHLDTVLVVRDQQVTFRAQRLDISQLKVVHMESECSQITFTPMIMGKLGLISFVLLTLEK